MTRWPLRKKLNKNKVKKRVCILFLLVFVLAACSHKPDGVLSSGKMQSVLIDMHRTDGIVSAKGFSYGHDLEVAALYQSVMDKHGITQAEFDSSLVWYTDHPLQFNRIYPKVIETLEKERDRYAERAEDALALQQQIRESKRGGWRDWVKKAMNPVVVTLWEHDVEPQKISMAPLRPGCVPFMLDTIDGECVYVPMRAEKLAFFEKK